MIKKSLSVMLLIVSFSCNKSGGNATIEIPKYSVDTVLVDAKGEFLYLEYDLITSDYCPLDGFLYNFSNFDHSIEKIDLDKLELVRKYSFEKEGPDGTGSWISTVKSIGEGKLLLAGEMAGIFTLEGKLIEKIDWDEEYFYLRTGNPHFDEMVFSLVIDHSANIVSLKKLSTADNLISTYEIDPEENYKKYTLGDLSTYDHWAPRVYLSSQKDKIIVSHEFSNDFYVYSPETDQVQAVKYTSTLTPSKVTIAAKGDIVNSTDDRILALESYLEEISFGKLVWDPQNKKYYRLSSSSNFGEEKREKRILHTMISRKVYLSVFNEQFNLINEMFIPEIKHGSSLSYFVKDGMIWIFENMDDEMGFIRIKIK